MGNLAGVWQGHHDAELSPLGETQAEQMAGRLQSEGIDFSHVISSDLKRAANTATAFNSPERFDALREIHVGRWENLRPDQVAEQFPEEMAKIRAGEIVKVGGGESWLDVWARVRPCLVENLQATPENGKLLVVVHGGVIATIVANLVSNARQPRDSGFDRLENTSITQLEVDEESLRHQLEPSKVSLKLRRFNDYRHLSEHEIDGELTDIRLSEHGKPSLSLDELTSQRLHQLRASESLRDLVLQAIEPKIKLELSERALLRKTKSRWLMHGYWPGDCAFSSVSMF